MALCSSAGHPFFDHCIAKVIENFDQWQTENIAGPGMLHDVLNSWDDSNSKAHGRVTILDSKHIFPFSWLDNEGRMECDFNAPEFDSQKCKQAYPDAFAITYWAHTWG